jgi:AcrB/AcrD/AcrF family
LDVAQPFAGVRENHVFLGREVPEKGALRYPDRIGDLRGRNAVETPLGKQPESGLDLMTAIVTILALSPLALGLSEGALLSASLATVVIGGRFSSTFLTLFVIPVVYSLFDSLKQRFTSGPAEPAEPATELPTAPVLTQ